jgi:D-aspartate ligase
MIYSERVNILIIDDNSSFVLSLLRSFSGYANIKVDILLLSDKPPNYFRYSRNLRKIYHHQLTEVNFEAIVLDVISKSSANFLLPTREWISKLIYQHKSSLEKIVRIHPVSDINTIETVNDKLRLNCWLEKNEFPFSITIKLTGRQEIGKLSESLSYPVLLKPVIGLGGQGIKLINNEDNLKAYIAEDKGYKTGFFLQEYIDGYDIGINIFSINGRILIYTIQRGLFSGGLTYSRGTEFIRNPGLFELTSAIISKLNYSGVANLDFRFDSIKGKFVLIDFNARYWSTLMDQDLWELIFP